MENVLSIGSKIGSTKIDKMGLASKDRQLLRRLAKLWRSYHKRDLTVRWKTGSLLNERLGPPIERLTHGQRVLKRAAAKLQMAESDLHRMRWFAFRFQSVADMQAKHPNVCTWTKIKELLSQRNAAANGKEEQSSLVNGNGEQSPGKAKDNVFVGVVLRSLGTATVRLRQGKVPLDGAAKERLHQAVQQLAEAISDRFGLRLTVEKV